MTAQSIGPLQRRFIDELRTTTKVQGTGKLHDLAGNYCCLGIACALFNIPKTILAGDRWSYGTISRDTSGVAPQELIALLKLHGPYGDVLSEGSSLVQMNDSKRLSFSAIADQLELHPEQYFSEPA